MTKKGITMVNRERIISIIKKVKANSNIKKADEFYETKVKLDFIHDLLSEKLLKTLEKEWNIDNIEVKELDWDWKKVEVKWKINTNFSSKSHLEIDFECPDQKINIEGNVSYIHVFESNTRKLLKEDEDNEKEFEYDFSINIDIQDVEIDLDINNGDGDYISIAPEELEYYNKKWKLNIK